MLLRNNREEEYVTKQSWKKFVKYKWKTKYIRSNLEIKRQVISLKT